MKLTLTQEQANEILNFVKIIKPFKLNYKTFIKADIVENKIAIYARLLDTNIDTTIGNSFKCVDVEPENINDYFIIQIPDILNNIKEDNGVYNIPVDKNKTVELNELDSNEFIQDIDIKLDIQKLYDISKFSIRCDYRPALSTTYIEVKDNTIEIVSTDTSKLVKFKTEVECEDFNLMIPSEIINVLNKLKLKSELFKIKIYEKDIKIKIKDIEITYRKPNDGKNILRYPDYNSVIPNVEEDHTKIELSFDSIKEEILPKIKKFLSTYKDFNENLRFIIKDNKIFIRCYDIETKEFQLEEIYTTQNKSPQQFHYDLKEDIYHIFNYILKYKPVNIKLYINSIRKDKAMIIKFDNELILVMPKMIDEEV